jgi:prepilin-type N-terminal cleavage/methylation domain-containing protein
MCFDRRRQKGFTFIEILMTLAVIAVLFVPVMQLFSNALVSTNLNLESITAMNLAQSEMERTINLNLTTEQLQKIGTQVFPPETEGPIEMNGQSWRIRREIVSGTAPLEVRVSVHKAGDPERAFVTLVTLVEDLMWDSVKTVSVT